MKTILGKTRIIKANRQAPNLKKLLTRAKFNNERTGVQKCSDNRCKTCPLLIEDTCYFFNETNKTIKISRSFTCSSSNIIYVIQCPTCKKSYIGETGDTLKHRCTLHRQHVRDFNNAPLQVSKHLATCGRGSFFITPIFQCYNDINVRKYKEEEFINNFKPDLNCHK